MAGETVLGGFVWRMAVKSTVKEDLAGAKKSVDDFDRGLKPATEDVNKLQASTKSMVRPLMDMSQGLVAVGASAYAAGTLMGESGEGFKMAGAGIMAMGSAAMMAKPLIQMFSSVLTGELIGSLNKMSSVLGSTRSELLLFTGAVGSIAVIGLYAYKAAADSAKKATEDKATAIKIATRATDDYNTATEKRISLEQKIAGIPQKEEDLRMKLIGDELAIRAAEMTQAGLGKGATLLEKDRAQYDVDMARLTYSRDWAAYFALPSEKSKLESELSTVRNQQGMAGLLSQSQLYTGPTGQMMANIGKGEIAVDVPLVGKVAAPVAGTGSYIGGVPGGTAIINIQGTVTDKSFRVDLTNKEKLNQQVG
jgi:hypothetical protein